MSFKDFVYKGKFVLNFAYTNVFLLRYCFKQYFKNIASDRVKRNVAPAILLLVRTPGTG